MAINKIMVLGAGTMGMGIAQVFAEAGKTVIVRDIAEAFIQRGEQRNGVAISQGGGEKDEQGQKQGKKRFHEDYLSIT